MKFKHLFGLTMALMSLMSLSFTEVRAQPAVEDLLEMEVLPDFFDRVIHSMTVVSNGVELGQKLAQSNTEQDAAEALVLFQSRTAKFSQEARNAAYQHFANSNADSSLLKLLQETLVENKNQNFNSWVLSNSLNKLQQQGDSLFENSSDSKVASANILDFLIQKDTLNFAGGPRLASLPFACEFVGGGPVGDICVHLWRCHLTACEEDCYWYKRTTYDPPCYYIITSSIVVGSES